MDVKRSLMLVVLVAVALVLGGCSKPAGTGDAANVVADPAKAAGQAKGGEAVEVRFTYSEKACYYPVVVAVEEGLYEAEGLKVVPKIVTGGIESAEALVSGQADMGTMGDAPTVICLSRSKDMRLICNQATGERMHRIVVREGGGIAGPKDLEGKKVAVQMGSSTHGALLLYCKKHGVDVSKISFVSLSPKDFPEAMIAKQVDAIAGSEPWPGNVLAKCKGSKELANLAGLGNNYPLPVLASTRFLSAHPEAAAAIVRATRKAAELIAKDPQRAAEVLARKSGISVERERKAMDDYEFPVELDEVTLGSLVQTAEFLKAQKKIETVPDVKALVDRTGLDDVASTTPGKEAGQ
jgi:sulfonate transport system substrate-binding protein